MVGGNKPLRPNAVLAPLQPAPSAFAIQCLISEYGRESANRKCADGPAPALSTQFAGKSTAEVIDERRNFRTSLGVWHPSNQEIDSKAGLCLRLRTLGISDTKKASLP